MPDRENVISLVEDAIEIVEKEAFWTIANGLRDAIALLKEQKAVEPTIDEYGNKRCGSCGHKLQSIADQDLFCCKCGKPVLWKGR